MIIYNTMKNLTDIQKSVIKEICDIQLKSLGNIFLQDEEELNSEIEERDPDVELDDFFDELVDTANYFKELKEDPNKIFDLDEDHAPAVIFILKNFWKDEANNSEIVELLTFFESNSSDEIVAFDEDIDIEDIIRDIEEGEGHDREFKPSILYNFTKAKGTQSTKYYIAKVICSFLNSDGGTLYIGVKDDGTIKGLDYDYKLFEGDYKKKKDMFKLTFDNLITYYFGTNYHSLVKLNIIEYQEKDIAQIKVEFSSLNPVFLLNRWRNPETGKYDRISKEFYVRGEASTKRISDVEEIIKYIRNKWDLST